MYIYITDQCVFIYHELFGKTSVTKRPLFLYIFRYFLLDGEFCGIFLQYPITRNLTCVVSKALARGSVSLSRADAMICKLILGLDDFFFWELGLDDLKTTACSTMGHSHYGCCWEPARPRGAVIMELGVLTANSFAV